MLTAVLLLAFAVDQKVDLPVKHLAFKDGVSFREGARGMGDAFPYLRVHYPHGRVPEQLTPKNLHGILDGKITTKQAAYEVVRLFVAGVPVEATQPLLTAAGKLELKHLGMGITPRSERRAIEKKDDVWLVSFVAYEMDRMLQLVQIDAKVTAGGKVEIKRTPIIHGPMTSWQTTVIDGQDDGGKDEAMRAEAKLARSAYAKALKAKRDLDTAFAIARLRLTPREIEDLWPGKRRPFGSGVIIVGFDLADGTTVIYDASGKDRPIPYLVHARDAKGPMKWGTTLHRLAALR
ncbi:MAG: hypothetical protein ACYTHK_07840 [Planctomycetota bacterium]|jgi:hypothetical protein